MIHVLDGLCNLSCRLFVVVILAVSGISLTSRDVSASFLSACVDVF